MKISELPQATEVTGEELLPVVQNGETKKVSRDDLVGTVPNGLTIENGKMFLVSNGEKVDEGAQLPTVTIDKVLSVESANPIENRAVSAAITELDGEILNHIEPNNILDTSALIDGYISNTGNGSVSSSSSLKHTPPIKVKEGDIIRTYSKSSNNTVSFYAARFIAAYKDGSIMNTLGTANAYQYVVPAGVDSVVITLSPSAINEITKNYEATEFEKYFPPRVQIKEDIQPVASEQNFGVCRIWTTVSATGEKVLNISTEETQ